MTNSTGETFVDWSFPVCITLVALVCCGSIAGLWFYKVSIWRFPQPKTWKSQFNISPTILLVFRILAFFYNLGVQIGGGIVFGAGQFQFYTIWSYIFLILFFGVGSVVSFLGVQNLQRSQVPTLLDKIFVVMYQMTLCQVLLVDAVLWGILYPMAIKANEQKPGSFNMELILNFFSYNQHGGNFVWIFVEFVLNDLPLFPIHLLWAFLWTATYAVFTWILHTLTDIWPYPFLETHVAVAPLWYGGILALHVFFYFVWYGGQQIKQKYCGTYKPQFHLVNMVDSAEDGLLAHDSDEEDELTESSGVSEGSDGLNQGSSE